MHNIWPRLHANQNWRERLLSAPNIRPCILIPSICRHRHEDVVFLVCRRGLFSWSTCIGTFFWIYPWFACTWGWLLIVDAKTAKKNVTNEQDVSRCLLGIKVSRSYRGLPKNVTNEQGVAKRCLLGVSYLSWTLDFRPLVLFCWKKRLVRSKVLYEESCNGR
jgi:hypothetical protein